jgi:Kdo2-lipid IVA lauroyltransferase/acyltransferase
VTDRTQSPTIPSWAALRPRLRHWRRYWIRDPLLGALNLGLHYGCRLLPTERCSAIGGRLGILNGRYRYHTVRRRAERFYLGVMGGSATQRDAEEAVMRAFDNAGRSMLEFSALDRLWDEGRIEVVGREHLLDARAAGRPVIVMGLHLGNWETIGPTIVQLGFRGAKGFYQPPRSRFEHKIVVVARERYGAIMLPNGITGARGAHRHLVEERGVFLMYADEERNGRVSAPLFGRPLPRFANILNIIRLAWASGAAVIPAHAERLSGARFRVTYLPPVELVPDGSDAAAALSENVERIDRLITPIVLAHLDQWYMLLEERTWTG